MVLPPPSVRVSRPKSFRYVSFGTRKLVAAGVAISVVSFISLQYMTLCGLGGSVCGRKAFLLEDTEESNPLEKQSTRILRVAEDTQEEVTIELKEENKQRKKKELPERYVRNTSLSVPKRFLKRANLINRTTTREFRHTKHLKSTSLNITELSFLTFNGTRYNGTCLEPSQEPVFPWQTRAPRAIILGTHRGGVMALRDYFQQHALSTAPESSVSHFFEDPEPNEARYRLSVKAERNMSGIHQYENQLSYAEKYVRHSWKIRQDERKFAIDVSYDYLTWSDRVPDEICCIAPWVKLIALLRNPIDRVVSMYNDQKRGDKDLTWDDYLGPDISMLKIAGVIRNWTEVDFESYSGSAEESLAWSNYLQSYVKRRRRLPVGRGLYAIQLENYMKAMERAGKPRSDLLVIQSETMFDNPQEIYNRVCKHVDLANQTLKDARQIGLHYHVDTTEQLPEHWRKTLETLYQPYNQRLYKLLNWDSVWSTSTTIDVLQA